MQDDTVPNTSQSNDSLTTGQEFYRPENMDGYSTHLPVLSRLIAETSGKVLEFGSGYYSTPMVLSVGGESIESDPTWRQHIQQFYPAVHGGSPREDRYGLILVDDSPPDRRRNHVLEMRDRCELFVLHDALPAWEPTHQFESLRSLFAYSYVYEKLCPFTMILSQTKIAWL